jgi:hypothetical protein
MKTLFDHLKLFWEVHIIGKEFVLNSKNGNIHHYSCEWCDNIKVVRRITREKAMDLIKNRSHVYKMATCCKNKINL